MRVLVLTSLYPPHAIGGYELACHDVMSRWAAGGDRVDVLTSVLRTAGDQPEPDVPGLTVRRELHPLHSMPLGLAPPRGRVLPLVALDRLRLRRAIRATKPDVVSIWHLGMLSLSLLADVARCGVPAVTVVCDMWPTYARRADPTSRLAGRPAVMQLPGRVVFCSAALREIVAVDVDPSLSNSDVVWLGVDRTTFPIDLDGPEPPERSWHDRLLYVGRLAEEKGTSTLVRSLAHMSPTTTLTLVGAGSDRERAALLRIASEVGARDRVTIGFRARRELPELYRSADALVFPSEWPEPFGIVPLEAMACATPVVATGTGGAGEYLVDGKNCVLYRPGDAAALAAGVDRLASDPTLRQKLVAGGRRTAAVIDTDRLAGKLHAIHAAVAGT